MAKTSKRRGPVTIIDEDGYETDGMYRWGGPKVPFSIEQFKHFGDSFNECFHKSAPDRIAELRERVTALLQPHVDGPYSRDDVALEKRTGTLTYLNLSTGSGAYVIDKGISERSYLDDAIRAVMALDELAHLLTKEPQNIDRIVRSSIEIGSTIAKAELRAYFASEVLIARKRRKASAKGGKARAKWNSEIEKVARPILLELNRARISESATYTRASARLAAEHSISISAKTIMRHLPLKELDKG